MCNFKSYANSNSSNYSMCQDCGMTTDLYDHGDFEDMQKAEGELQMHCNTLRGEYETLREEYEIVREQWDDREPEDPCYE